MREILESMRDSVVAQIVDFDKGAALIAHDGMSEMIDKAEELASAAAVQVAPVSLIRDMLHETLSAALVPLPKPKKHGDSKRNAKKRTTGRKAPRKLKTSKR